MRMRQHTSSCETQGQRERQRSGALFQAMALRYSPTYDDKKLKTCRLPTAPRWNASSAGFLTMRTHEPCTARRYSCSCRAPVRGTPQPPGRAVYDDGVSKPDRRPTSGIRGRAIWDAYVTKPRPSLKRARRARSSSAGPVPGASHMVHMPSHTWTQIGRWGDAVRSSLECAAYRPACCCRAGLRDSSRPQPAHADLRGVDGRSGQRRRAGGSEPRQARRRHDVSNSWR